MKYDLISYCIDCTGMYIPACVFLYSNCVYVCVRGRGRKRGEGGGREWGREKNERNNDDRIGSSNIESVWKQPHLGVSKSCKIEQSSYGNVSFKWISVTESVVGFLMVMYKQTWNKEG